MHKSWIFRDLSGIQWQRNGEFASLHDQELRAPVSQNNWHWMWLVKWLANLQLYQPGREVAKEAKQISPMGMSCIQEDQLALRFFHLYNDNASFILLAVQLCERPIG